MQSKPHQTKPPATRTYLGSEMTASHIYLTMARVLLFPAHTGRRRAGRDPKNTQGHANTPSYLAYRGPHFLGYEIAPYGHGEGVNILYL